MDLFNRVTPDTLLLTPNRRLSAEIVKQHSCWQISQNKICWATLNTLPLFPTWLTKLWNKYTASVFSDNTILLTHYQEQILWEKILRASTEHQFLLQLSETAKLAKSAWETLKRWQVPLDEPQLKLTEDSRAFLSWATQFQKLCQKNNWIDQNSLADIIAEKIKTKQIQIPQKILLIGFTELAPQYQSIFTICKQLGTQVESYTTPSRNQTVATIKLPDTDIEIRTMANWAKSLLGKSSSIACVIPKLEILRERSLKIFSDIMEPGSFNISAGKNLASYPIIHDALQFLNLNPESISLNSFASLLRSPFIGEAEYERFNRAQFDLRIRHLNLTTVSIKQLLKPSAKLNLSKLCPALTSRLKLFFDEIQRNKSQIQSIRQWVDTIIKLLNLLGWPGERSLNSPEYQVVQNGWLPLLNEYAGCDTIIGQQNFHQALHFLTCITNSTMYQPESPAAPIQILGILEAADIPFEHTWVMGLDDTSWPSRPKPNPFIPLRLQKSLNMPNASPDRELHYSQKLMQQLHNSANHIIFSYPQQNEESELRPSSLLKSFNLIDINELSISFTPTTAETIFSAKEIDSIQDSIAPSISLDEKTYGGVGIFKNQAMCPFKAFAEHRLHAKKTDEPELGLRKLDRGIILHKSLELIWQELKNSHELKNKSKNELVELIHNCADLALKQITEFNPGYNKRYLALELSRLEKLLWNWMEIEKARPPFSVLALEKPVTATIGSITTEFRVDRIDLLEDEPAESNQLIIDYKTGKEFHKKDWFGARLSEPQLPIYCMVNPTETTAIAFAKISPHKMEVIGISRNPIKIKSIELLSNIKQADGTLWDEQLVSWQTHLVQLSDDFYQGKADVSPKDIIQTCRYCGLQPLCRIHEQAYLDDETIDEY